MWHDLDDGYAHVLERQQVLRDDAAERRLARRLSGRAERRPVRLILVVEWGPRAHPTAEAC